MSRPAAPALAVAALLLACSEGGSAPSDAQVQELAQSKGVFKLLSTMRDPIPVGCYNIPVKTNSFEILKRGEFTGAYLPIKVKATFECTNKGNKLPFEVELELQVFKNDYKEWEIRRVFKSE